MLEVSSEHSKIAISGDFILVACGTRPAREPGTCFDGAHVIDSDELFKISSLPKETIVVGGGIVGLEHASLLAALGSEVTLIDEQTCILDFVDREIVEALIYHLRRFGTILRLGEKVARVEINDWRDQITAELESGKKVQGDLLVCALGRRGNADHLRLEAAGLQTDSRGRLKVNGAFQTEVPHIYAADDVIGFPSLASTAMERSPLATCHMFGIPCEHTPAPSPYGIYTIPEISMVGQTEQELTRDKVPTAYPFSSTRYYCL
jgi:NAD(P) transhydrogenase